MTSRYGKTASIKIKKIRALDGKLPIFIEQFNESDAPAVGQ
jgi:hypothetical protein